MAKKANFKLYNGTSWEEMVFPPATHTHSEYVSSTALSEYLKASTASTLYQPKDSDLTAIAGLTGTKGLLKKNGDGLWSLDTNTYLTSHQSLVNYSTLANTIKSLSISGKTITYTKGDGSTGTLTTQDTTYSNATTSAAGLMSATDKTNLNTLVNLLADNDSNTTVNTIQEVLNVFSSYPEGTNLANALAGKLDKTGGTVKGDLTIERGSGDLYVDYIMNNDGNDYVQSYLNDYATKKQLSTLDNKFINYVEKSSPNISGLYLTDSVIYTDNYEFYFPTSGSGICTIATQDWASGAFLGKTAKASSATVADSANSVAWGNVSGKPSSFTPASHTHDYLPLSGGTLTSLLTLTHDKAQLQFRGGHNSYDAVVSYQTSGNEAMVFSTKNAVTSFMFVNGEDTINNVTSSRWTSLTPGLQVKNNCVAISKLITNGTTPTYNLDVGGSANATTLYENGTTLSEKYQAKGSYLTGITKAMVTSALGYTPPTSDTNTWRGIQDNLTSTSTTDSLSANQGRVLNSNKLDKSGGTMTGPLIYANTSGNNKSSNYISAGGGYSTGSGRLGLKIVAIDQSDAQMGMGVDLTGGPYELTVATGRSSDTGTSKIVFATHTSGTTAYKTLATLSSSAAATPTATFNVNGTIQENGTSLSDKYQAKGTYLTSSSIVKVNGSAQSSSTTIYAPTSAGENTQILISNGGGSPSWFSLKTVNGNSLIGSGNVQISGGSGGGVTLYWSGRSTLSRLTTTIFNAVATKINGRSPLVAIKIDNGDLTGWALGRYDDFSSGSTYDDTAAFTGFLANGYGDVEEFYGAYFYGGWTGTDYNATEIYVIGG